MPEKLFGELLQDWAAGRVHAGLLGPTERFRLSDQHPRNELERAEFAAWVSAVKPPASVPAWR